MSRYIVAAIGDWNRREYEDQSSGRSNEAWYLVQDEEQLTDMLKEVTPRFIFFLHWRWIVPKEIYSRFECICFHMTDLPYGRGGSPLQNLIIRGHEQTMLTCLKMNDVVDGGPIYFKRKLSLSGAAWEVYERASKLSWEMIFDLISKEITPSPQMGKVTVFKRRKPKDSEIPENINGKLLYDFIRMLDAPGYPKAFMNYKNRLLEFHDATFDGDKVEARVTIMETEK